MAQKDASFRSYYFQKFRSFKEITWYGNKLNINELINKHADDANMRQWKTLRNSARST